MAPFHHGEGKLDLSLAAVYTIGTLLEDLSGGPSVSSEALIDAGYPCSFRVLVHGMRRLVARDRWTFPDCQTLWTDLCRPSSCWLKLQLEQTTTNRAPSRDEVVNPAEDGTLQRHIVLTEEVQRLKNELDASKAELAAVRKELMATTRRLASAAVGDVVRVVNTVWEAHCTLSQVSSVQTVC